MSSSALVTTRTVPVPVVPVTASTTSTTYDPVRTEPVTGSSSCPSPLGGAAMYGLVPLGVLVITSASAVPFGRNAFAALRIRSRYSMA